MNVRQLIEELKKYPSEMDVCIWDDDEDTADWVPVVEAMHEDGSTCLSLLSKPSGSLPVHPHGSCGSVCGLCGEERVVTMWEITNTDATEISRMVGAYLHDFGNTTIPARELLHTHFKRAFERGRITPAPPPVPEDPAHPHIIGGEFQSDKYPSTPRGFVPLKCSDPKAQPLLWEYAESHRTVDPDFSIDLETCLLNKGFNPTTSEGIMVTTGAALLDEVETASPIPVGAPNSLMRRAWALGRKLKECRENITLALGAVRHGDYKAAIEMLQVDELGEPKEKT